MPCTRSTSHRRFRPHFPPGSLQCCFTLELVSPLTHAMKLVFAKLDNGPADGTLGSPPPSPLTPIAPTSLIPKPSGEIGRVGHGGYTLRDILEQEHGWEDGLYHKIREEYVAWLTNIWKRPCPILLKQNNLIDLLLSAKRPLKNILSSSTHKKLGKSNSLRIMNWKPPPRAKLEPIDRLDSQLRTSLMLIFLFVES
ncbi:hypothetical protein EDB85DRAFT_2153274 [Lactarius pseudohatsudake]|nr:hypothetical protein EDB85DRAFT_2153274 [Lactarius pseudohatsudake]